MKNSVILDIFHGRRGQLDLLLPPTNEELDEKIETVTEKLKKNITHTEFVRVMQLIDLLSIDLCDKVDYYYQEGFLLGFALAKQCLSPLN